MERPDFGKTPGGDGGKELHRIESQSQRRLDSQGGIHPRQKGHVLLEGPPGRIGAEAGAHQKGRPGIPGLPGLIRSAHRPRAHQHVPPAGHASDRAQCSVGAQGDFSQRQPPREQRRGQIIGLRLILEGNHRYEFEPGYAGQYIIEHRSLSN